MHIQSKHAVHVDGSRCLSLKAAVVESPMFDFHHTRHSGGGFSNRQLIVLFQALRKLPRYVRLVSASASAPGQANARDLPDSRLPGRAPQLFRVFSTALSRN